MASHLSWLRQFVVHVAHCFARPKLPGHLLPILQLVSFRSLLRHRGTGQEWTCYKHKSGCRCTYVMRCRRECELCKSAGARCIEGGFPKCTENHQQLNEAECNAARFSMQSELWAGESASHNQVGRLNYPPDKMNRNSTHMHCISSRM